MIVTRLFSDGVQCGRFRFGGLAVHVVRFAAFNFDLNRRAIDLNSILQLRRLTDRRTCWPLLMACSATSTWQLHATTPGPTVQTCRS